MLTGLCILAAWLTLAAWVVLPTGQAPDDGALASADDPDGATPRAVEAHPVDRRAAGEAAPEPAVVEIFYDYDIFDERFVVFLSDNVFVGRVLGVSGRESATTTIPGPDGERPQVQYAVRVLDSVKASGPEPLRDGQTAAVNRNAPPRAEAGAPAVLEALACGAHATDQEPQVGDAYVFSTYYEADRRLHTLTAQPTGAVPVWTSREAVVGAYERAVARQADPLAPGAEPCG